MHRDNLVIFLGMEQPNNDNFSTILYTEKHILILTVKTEN